MQEKLISGMQAAFPGESQASLARRAGLSVQRFNNYVTGIRTMDVDAVIGCAQALGWDIRETVAEHEIETAPTPRVKAYWRKLAGSVAMVLCAIGVSSAGIENAHATRVSGQHVSEQHGSMPIMSKADWGWWWHLATSWLAWRLRGSKPTNGSLDACQIA